MSIDFHERISGKKEEKIRKSKKSKKKKQVEKVEKVFKVENKTFQDIWGNKNCKYFPNLFLK
jgi:hypothetical protein